MLQPIKTTLYFDPDLYYAAKRLALERRQTTTELVQNALKKEVYQLSRIKKNLPKKTKSAFDELCPGFDMGPIKGNLSREELYDFV